MLRVTVLCCAVATLLLVVPASAQGAPPAGEASGAEAALFYLFGLAAVGSAIGVVVSADIVRAAVWLLGALGAVAALYFLLMANFLGAIQLIVYAGGIMVLIVFGVMLTSKSPWMRFNPRPIEVVGGAVVFCLLFAALATAVVWTDWPSAAQPLSEPPRVAVFGQELLTTYLVPFEAASVLLLVVMIGAAYLAKPPGRREKMKGER